MVTVILKTRILLLILVCTGAQIPAQLGNADFLR